MVDEVVDVLEDHRQNLEETIEILVHELRKVRQDGDYYRKKLATALNEYKMRETDILLLQKQLREKDAVLAAKDKEIAELKQENDVMQREYQTVHQHATELKELVGVAFDDSGRNRRLLQQHLHYGCTGTSPTSDEQQHQQQHRSFASQNVSDRFHQRSPEPDPRPMPSGYAPQASGIAALRQGLTMPNNTSSVTNRASVRGTPPSTGLSTGFGGSGGLPMSPNYSSSNKVDPRALLDRSSDDGGLVRSNQSSPEPQAIMIDGDLLPTHEARSTVVEVDVGRSLGVKQSESGSLCSAVVNNALACFTSLKDENLHYVAKIRSCSVGEVVLGIESESTGTLLEFGFRNSGYVLAVTRKGWKQERDIWRGVLKTPIDVQSSDSGSVQMIVEVKWHRQTRTLAIMINGQNLTNGGVIITSADNQPPPYFPTVTLPGVGDEVIVMR